MKKLAAVLTISACVSSLFAADIINNGDIKATNGHDIYATGDLISDGNIRTTVSGGYVRAQTYFYTPGYANIVSYITSGYYVQAPIGIFTNVLRSGGSLAPANLSVALGALANATSYSSIVVGRNNLQPNTYNATQWVDTDPLFVVGNGNGIASDPNQYRNAFTVFKDGTVTMSKAQGDILMGQFGN